MITRSVEFIVGLRTYGLQKRKPDNKNRGKEEEGHSEDMDVSTVWIERRLGKDAVSECEIFQVRGEEQSSLYSQDLALILKVSPTDSFSSSFVSNYAGSPRTFPGIAHLRRNSETHPPPHSGSRDGCNVTSVPQGRSSNPPNRKAGKEIQQLLLAGIPFIQRGTSFRIAEVGSLQR
jgi:hypothetical protein